METLVSGALVALAAILKSAAVYSIARLLRAAHDDALGAILAGWLLLHAGFVCLLLILSQFAAVTGAVVWLALIVSTLALLSAMYMRRPAQLGLSIRPCALGIMLFSAAAAVMTLRAMVFQDFTFDAQTYGIVREAIWMNYRSILIHMPTPQVNVFANEWNGELLALGYGLVSFGIQGLLFGGVEMLVVLFLSTMWLLQRLGSTPAWSALAAAAITVTPACIGISGLIKGDLLAVACLVMAAGWLVALRANRSVIASSMLPGSLACCIGSKITALPIALAVGCVALRPLLREIRRHPIVAGYGFGLALVFLSRYVINAMFYGNPLHRVETEVAAPGLITLAKSIMFIGDQLFAFSVRKPNEPQGGYMLAGAMGGTFVLAMVCLIYQWQAGLRPRPTAMHLLIAAVAGLLVAGFLIPPLPWAFRFFLPGALLVVIVMMAIPTTPPRILMVGTIAAALANFSYISWWGEITAARTIPEALRALPPMSFLDRALAMTGPLRSDFGLEKFNFDRKEPLTVAVFQDINRAISPYIGSRAQNRLYMADSVPGLSAIAKAKCPDYVIITKRFPAPLSSETKAAIENLGYQWDHESGLVAIASIRNAHRGPRDRQC